MNVKTCRNGKHPWTAANIYKQPSTGKKSCMRCQEERREARKLNGPPQKSHHVPGRRYAIEYDEKHLNYLRSLVGCLGCGRTPGADGWTEHVPGCPVPHNREGKIDDGTPAKKRGRPRKPWNHTCEQCQGPIPEPPSRKGVKPRRYCSDACRSRASVSRVVA